MVYIDNETVKGLNFLALKRYKKITLILATLLLLCGAFCLLVPIYSGIALSYIMGVLFVISGMYSLASSFFFKRASLGSFFSLFLFGIIYVFIGASVIASPMMGMNILSMLICVLFLLGGISRLTTAFKNREMTGRYWCFFIGILDFIIAFLWLGANEYTSYILTVMLVGLEMVFSAWFFFMLSYDFDSHKKVKTIA